MAAAALRQQVAPAPVEQAAKTEPVKVPSMASVVPQTQLVLELLHMYAVHRQELEPWQHTPSSPEVFTTDPVLQAAGSPACGWPGVHSHPPVPAVQVTLSGGVVASPLLLPPPSFAAASPEPSEP